MLILIFCFGFLSIPFACSSQITAMEVQISALKKNLEEEHDRWRCAQANYERQVTFGYLILGALMFSIL